MKVNFHSHTGYCPHASGSVEEYVVKAVENGYDEIGFTDHCPWPGYRKRFPLMRMLDEELPQYVADVRRLQKEYEGKIRIYLGLEAEIFPEYMNWLRETVEEYDMDYVIFGNHHDYLFSTDQPYLPEILAQDGNMNRVLATMERGMESGVYSCVAHPDLYMRYLSEFTPECADAARRICRMANACGLPIEYNLLGVRYNARDRHEGYPHHRFWEIAAEENCRCVIGLDAHSPDDYALQEEPMKQARAFLAGLGMTPLDSIAMRTHR